jgi:hypothetical protein
LESRVLADHGGQLETVQIRHAYIDENQRHIVLEQAFKGFTRGRGLEQIFAHFGQHHLMAQQLRLLVVDQQNVHLIGGEHDCRSVNDAATSAAQTSAAGC